MTYPVNATFRPRPPWLGGHLQTVQDRITRPRYPLRATETLMVTVSDGDKLAVQVNRPQRQPGGPVVTLIHGLGASDAGLPHHAERHYLGGVAADDIPLAANLLSSLSYQMATIGDRREAVLLATSAAEGARATATATTRALLAERVAWANARLGDPNRTQSNPTRTR